MNPITARSTFSEPVDMMTQLEINVSKAVAAAMQAEACVALAKDAPHDESVSFAKAAVIACAFTGLCTHSAAEITRDIFSQDIASADQSEGSEAEAASRTLETSEAIVLLKHAQIAFQQARGSIVALVVTSNASAGNHRWQRNES